MAVRAARKIEDCAQSNSDRLDLHGQGMIKVPLRVFTLRQLTTLRLGANHLRVLPREIGQLTLLRVLNLLNNQLVDLPREIAQLRALETIHLSSNQFTSPPWILGCLPALRAVTLAHNPLEYAVLVPEPTLRAAIQRGETTADWTDTATWIKTEWTTREASLLSVNIHDSGSSELAEPSSHSPLAAGTAAATAPGSFSATGLGLAHGSVSGGSVGLVPFSRWAIEEGKEPVDSPFGRVLEITYRNTHLIAYSLRREQFVPEAIAAFAAQAAVLSQLAHRNILHTVGYCLDHPPDVYVLAELVAPGSLLRALQDPARQPKLAVLETSRRIARGIAEGLHYLHVHGIIHGALCADSVWLNNEYSPKIADIGLAQRLDPMRARRVSPVRWWAPERLAAPVNSLGDFSVATDVWALGITLTELYSGGEAPFVSLVDDAVLSKFILHQRGTPERPDRCPPPDWDCVRPCFAFRPEDRCSALGVLAGYERLERTTHYEKQL